VAVRRTAIRDAGGRVQGMIECARALEPMDSDSPAEKQLRLLVEQCRSCCGLRTAICDHIELGIDFNFRK